VSVALAGEALRRFSTNLPRAVADGSGRAARAECLIAAWLAGSVLTAGSWLQHKLAHVLGGFGLPHAEAHAIILPHVTRFNLAAGGPERGWLTRTLGGDEPAEMLAALLAGFPIPHRLRDVGFDQAKIPDAAGQIAALAITQPRRVTADDAAALLRSAY
jgi:maleylacetate reductase